MHPLAMAIIEVLKLIEQTDIYKRSDNEVRIHRQLLAALRAQGVLR